MFVTRWLRFFNLHRRRGLILVTVIVILWFATIYSINSSHSLIQQDSNNIKTEVLRLSEKYIRTLARDNEGVVDGPYAGRFTAYDLKKTMAVLLESILERLDRIESKLNITSNLTLRIQGHKNQLRYGGGSVQAKDLIRGDDQICELTEKEKQLYPRCMGKIGWMKEMWKSDPCYAAYGVDGSMCSFIMYLSEIEGWCPRSAWHGHGPAPPDTSDGSNKANITTSLAGLMKLLVDPNERQGYAWMRMRIKRIWHKWDAAITNLSKKQDLSHRKQKKILVHLGLLSKQSGWKFAEMQFKGGPLGELVQWSDLITALYILGHQLTITSEADQLSSCLLRVVDSFGTEPAFNLRGFAKQRKKLTSWGGQDLQPQQFFTMFRRQNQVLFGKGLNFMDLPKQWKKLASLGGQDLQPQQFFTMFAHSPDNSFMGFVVEQHLNESTSKDIKREDIAVVYGKNTYMWRDKEQYLSLVNKSGIVIHGTVYIENKSEALEVPDYVKNHGILNGEDLHLLLRKSKIFIGLGFPFEGPAPLEAIANGAVFINPKFTVPKNRNTDKFFKGKPTERELTSQHPYAEQFIGEPYVYTIQIEHAEEVRTTVQKILDTDHFKGYLPYEYTEEGFIQRMNAYIEHQNFCQFQRQLSKWPPEHAVKILFGEPGKSCKDVCWEKNLICEPSHFLETNAHEVLMRHGASCAANKTLTDIFFPALDMKTNDCILQQEELLFSCVGKQENLRRLCPCRNYIKGQTALCQSCTE